MGSDTHPAGTAHESRRPVIALVDMDAFFVSVEVALDPTLAGKPVIVGGDPGGRGVVAAASYEVRKYGVHSAMPLAQAKRLCPSAIFLRGNHAKYAEYSDLVMEILGHYSPVVRPVSLDEAYVDLTGCERLHKCGPVDIAEKMRAEIREKTSLPCSVGIGTSPVIAKIASESAKPNGVLMVLPGNEKRFLAPLPVRRMPGVGEKTEPRLLELGIKTIGDVCRFSEEMMTSLFGSFGSWLWRQSNGDENAYRQNAWFGTILDSDGEEDMPKSIGNETTFETDSIDPDFITSAISRLSAKACRRLRAKGLTARKVTLKLRYSDFKTVTSAKTLPDPTELDKTVYHTALGIFRQLYSRRVRVRLVGVTLSALEPAGGQIRLFADPVEAKLKRLYDGMDRIRQKFGSDSVSTLKSMRSK